MRRTVPARVLLKASALAGAGLLGVTACSSLQIGAAAVTDTGRITNAQLANEVASLKADYQALKNRAPLPYSTAAMPRDVLSWLLRFQIMDRLAVREGIHITTTRSQFALRQVQNSVAQQGSTLPVAAIRSALPLNLLPELGRYFAIVQAVNGKLDNNVPPGTTAGQQALGNRFALLECQAAKSLQVQVNPQYGELDYSGYQVVPVSSTLAAFPGNVRRPGAVQSKPPC